MIQIKINDDWYLQSHNFAEQCMETCRTNYSRRGQNNPEKIIEDIHCGKLVELGVYKLLKTVGQSPTFPDFTIYEGKKKSYDADIYSGKYRFHVKGQTEQSMRSHSPSWLFTYGKYSKDPLLVSPEKTDFLVPGYVKGRDVIIWGIYPFVDICEKGIIGLPKVPKMGYYKRAIYKVDLDFEFGENYWSIFQSQIEDRYQNDSAE